MKTRVSTSDTDMSRENSTVTELIVDSKTTNYHEYDLPVEESYTTINCNEFNRLWAETNRATKDIRAIIDDMLQKQGTSIKDVLGTKTATKQAISEGGELDTQTVSDRIISFAKGIPKKITRKKYITN